MYFYRSLIAAITIIVISLINKINFKFEFDKISIMCSLTYSFILVLCKCYKSFTTEANAIFLQLTAPIYLLILEPVFLKTKFDKKNLIALIFCLIGMILFFFSVSQFVASIKGNLLAIGSGISFRLVHSFLKWKKQIHKTENTIVYIIAEIFLYVFLFSSGV
ncbi:MAG: EamA family transporter [Ignavibacteria bacterium]|nr:EamA family transporter [Ignavibacteria bacterium]